MSEVDPGVGKPRYSKDYWDLVFEQLGKRRLFKAGLAVLAVLYGTAIFAPFLAGDRPFTFEGVDRGGFNAAVRSLRPVTAGMVRLAGQDEEAYRAKLETAGTLGDAAAPQTLEAALAVEVVALSERLDRIRGALPEDGTEAFARGALEELETRVDEATEDWAPDRASARASLEEAERLAVQFVSEVRAFDPQAPWRGGLKLVGRRSYPLWDAISGLEVFFMALWILLVAWPLWNRALNGLVLGGDRERIRRWRRRKALCVMGLSVAAGLGWFAAFGPGESLYQNGPFKAGLTDGSWVALPEGHQLGATEWTFVPTFPPIPYGLAETHQEEQFRPPTWWWWAPIDEAGRYLRGPKVEEEGTGVFTAALSPVEVRYAEPPRNHPARHLAGVDELGRDFLARLVWGGRTSLTVGILSAFLLTVIGVVFGALAGYFGGWVDTAIMRLIEVLQAIPAFFLILMTMAFIPAEVISPIFAIVIVIALIRWTGVARLVRGEFLRLREQEFVVAARALGFHDARTIFRHVLPNAMGPVLVSAAFAVAAGILTESAVSFLGFGIRPPEASWGSLVNESKNPANWWIQLFPGVLIFVTVTCYNLVGDAVRDALDPKMKI
ncbi:MAG: ABC transporter permease subunit [Planctomycetes bacterium]|nr:ABC transporter permease subunit [Planctomycetota bacterium]MDA0948298.1 ABC transporter permease subunit [Planctomycetota bacterium]